MVCWGQRHLGLASAWVLCSALRWREACAGCTGAVSQKARPAPEVTEPGLLQGRS